jgi:hypothetical protein
MFLAFLKRARVEKAREGEGDKKKARTWRNELQVHEWRHYEELFILELDGILFKTYGKCALTS